MIVRLKGRVEDIYQDSLLLMCNAIGFRVFCSEQTRETVTLGEESVLEIVTQMRDGDVRFYGFSSVAERSCFALLSRVQGVGGKLALAILSCLGPEGLQRALAEKDKAALIQVTGLGARLATRLLSELEGKVGGEDALSLKTTADSSTAALWRDAAAALEALGFESADIARTREALRAKEEGRGFSSLEEVLRAALRELRPSER